MPRTKIVNGIRYDFTPEEEAQYEADAEAFTGWFLGAF